MNFEKIHREFLEKSKLEQGLALYRELCSQFETTLFLGQEQNWNGCEEKLAQVLELLKKMKAFSYSSDGALDSHIKLISMQSEEIIIFLEERK